MVSHDMAVGINPLHIADFLTGSGVCVTLGQVDIFRLFIPVLLAAYLAPAAADATDKWDPWKQAPAPAPDKYSPDSFNRQLGGETNPVKLVGLGAIRLYQIFIGPGLAPRCQFHPSCSRYTFTAIQEKGFINGTYMGAERLLRCNGRAHLQGYPEWKDTGLMEDSMEGKEAPLPWLSRLGF